MGPNSWSVARGRRTPLWPPATTVSPVGRFSLEDESAGGVPAAKGAGLRIDNALRDYPRESASAALSPFSPGPESGAVVGDWFAVAQPLSRHWMRGTAAPRYILSPDP